MTIVVTMKDGDGKYIFSNSEVGGRSNTYSKAYWKQNVFF